MTDDQKTKNDNKSKAYQLSSDEKFIKWWSTVRSAGKQAYAIQGALIFSILYIIIREVSASTLFNRGDYKFNINSTLLNTVIMSIIIYGYKIWTWNNNEKRFDKLNKDQGTK